jgi:WD40 repeat protein
LAVVEDDGTPLIISGGRGAGGRGGLRSWLLDGGPGGLHVRDAHAGPITALAVVEHRGAPPPALIISGGEDGALRSWRLNGTRGPLQVHDAHAGSLSALAVVEHRGAPLIISGGADGSLRSWRLGGSLAALEDTTAQELEVRQLSLGSLEIVVQLPADVLTAVGVTAVGFRRGSGQSLGRRRRAI